MQLNPLETSNSHSFTNVMREAIVQFTSSENIRAGFQVGSTIQPWVPAHVMLLGRKLRSNPQEARADRGSHQQSNTVILSGRYEKDRQFDFGTGKGGLFWAGIVHGYLRSWKISNNN
ncbi:uncharacterized protein [Physcomitrium patens]|uniref:uncharacterized protein n=1 Tax=Physcomitrium patens TaxID=3218 RepID=UPI003CCE51D6